MATSGLGNCGCCNDDNWDDKVRALSAHFAFYGYTPLTWTEPTAATWSGPPATLYLKTVSWYEYAIELYHYEGFPPVKVSDGTWTMTVIYAYTINKYTGVESLYPAGTVISGRPDNENWDDALLTSTNMPGTLLTDSVTDTERITTYTADWFEGYGYWKIDTTATQTRSEEYTQTEYETLWNALKANVTFTKLNDKYNETEWMEAGEFGYNSDGTIGERWLIHDETIEVGGVDVPNTTWIQTITVDDGITGPSGTALNYFLSTVDGDAWSYQDTNVKTGFNNLMLNQNGFSDSQVIGQSYFGWGNAEYVQYQFCDPYLKTARRGFESYMSITRWPIDPDTEANVWVQFVTRDNDFCPEWDEDPVQAACCTEDVVTSADHSIELGGTITFYQEWKRSEMGGCSSC